MDIKDILEEVALPARSNKHGFKVTDKLEKIEEVLKREGSPFYLIRKSDHAWIFGQEKMEWDKKALLVSSHADIVKDITKPFSELDEEKKYFKGTYDNLGTNAACVDLMLNHEMPKNVYFSFTAEEESGKNTGAEFSYAYVRNRTGCSPDVIVLDVTYEGYDNDRLFTIEGLTAPSEKERTDFLNKIYQIEGDKQSFEVVRMKEKDNNDFLPKSYRSKELTDADESYFYAKQNCLSFSMDLPTDGNMHSDSGLYTKEAVMYGYCASLAQMCYVLTKTYPEKVEALTDEKDTYVKRAEETAFRKNSYSYGGSWLNDYPSIYHPIYGRSKEAAFEEEQIEGQMSIEDYLSREDMGYTQPDEDVSFFECLEAHPEYGDRYIDMESTAYQSAYECIEYDLAYDVSQFLEDMKCYFEEDLSLICGLQPGSELPSDLQEELVSIWECVREEQEEYGDLYDDY